MSPENSIATATANIMSGRVSEMNKARARSKTIRIGSYDLAEEDEAILVRSIVATEVKKAARLVELMKKRGIQAHTNEHHDDGLSVGSWYRTGGDQLDREIQQTLEGARGGGRIGAYPEPHAGGDEQTWSV